MPKARKSTRNSDAMDAEGHEEVRDVFVVFYRVVAVFLSSFLSLSVSFYALSSEEISPLLRVSQFVQFNQFNF